MKASGSSVLLLWAMVRSYKVKKVKGRERYLYSGHDSLTLLVLSKLIVVSGGEGQLTFEFKHDFLAKVVDVLILVKIEGHVLHFERSALALGL